MIRSVARFSLATLVFVGGIGGALSQPPKGGNPADEAAILKNAEAFVAAFNKGDAAALAAAWAPEGNYTSQSGTKLVGREAITKSFQEYFAANKGGSLRIDIASLRFITPDVAIEDGITSVLRPGGLPPSRARYTIVHVKKDGNWLLDSVRETVFTPPSNYEHLKMLEWMIGEWVDDVQEGDAARIMFEWTDNQNFIISQFTTTVKDVNIGGGTQWIGWDPIAKSVRSWMFETTGAFGEGTWSADGAKWTIKTNVVLPDGKKAAATNVVTRVDANSITWEVTGRTLDGKPLPDIKSAKMKRVTDSPRIIK